MPLALLVNLHLVPSFRFKVCSSAVCPFLALALPLLSLTCVTLGKSLCRALEGLSGTKRG